MPGTVNLSNELESFETGMDSVVIRRKGGRIIGGRSLNMEGFNEKYVKAGHIIIRSTNDEYDYKPMPVSDNAYSSLPENYEYAGIWVRTTPASDARGAIQYDGEINDKALPYLIDSIKAALKTALPSLYFMHD